LRTAAVGYNKSSTPLSRIACDGAGAEHETRLHAGLTSGAKTICNL
jgi:hypothetical protein